MIDRKRLAAFERLLWRACRGNVFVKMDEIEEELIDPRTVFLPLSIRSYSNVLTARESPKDRLCDILPRRSSQSAREKDLRRVNNAYVCDIEFSSRILQFPRQSLSVSEYCGGTT